jgi:hypothetical protein
VELLRYPVHVRHVFQNVILPSAKPEEFRACPPGAISCS